MKRLFFAVCALFILGACSVEEEVQDIGGAYVDGVFVPYCSAEAAPVIYTKEGFPIIDDQACIPEPEVLGITITPPGPPIVPPNCEALGNCPPPPTCEELGNCPPPPTCEELGNCPPPPPEPLNCRGNQVPNEAGTACVDKEKCNSGRGNGDEGGTCDPGNSGGKNQGGDNETGAGSKGYEGFGNLSIAEQTFLLWDINNRVDYDAYWQWLLDNGYIIVE